MTYLILGINFRERRLPGTFRDYDTVTVDNFAVLTAVNNSGNTI